MLKISFALIAITSVLISIHDIKYRKIPVLLLGINLISIIFYIYLRFGFLGLTLGVPVITVFIISMLKNINIDYTYILLCIGTILLLRANQMFNAFTVIPFIVCAVVLFNYDSKVPHMVCLSIGITTLLIGGLL